MFLILYAQKINRDFHQNRYQFTRYKVIESQIDFILIKIIEFLFSECFINLF